MAAGISAPPEGYLDAAERYAGRPFAHRADLDLLVGAAREAGLAAEFSELLFLARFWDGAVAILRREGPASEETGKLSAELAAATERIHALLRTLFGAGGAGPAADRTARYCAADRESMGRLSRLLAELSVLKTFDLREAGR